MADAFCQTDIQQVLSEVLAGDSVALSRVGEAFPGHRKNTHINPATTWRWASKGTKAADGRIVRLEAVRIGNRWLTSTAAVARFVTALTAAHTPGAAKPR